MATSGWRYKWPLAVEVVHQWPAKSHRSGFTASIPDVALLSPYRHAAEAPVIRSAKTCGAKF